MHLNELEIDGFGVWSGLKLDRLSDGINVIYGPNEAGKSTLLQFIRAMLYGFTPARSSRFLPPVQGGHAGGRLEFTSAGERYRLERRPHANERNHADEVALQSAGGRTLDPDQMPALLNHLDESIFQNVFAVGLTEMQELGTLTDTEASRMLYDLTTGLERVSLGEVVRELGASRRRLLAADGQSGELRRLLTERQRLLEETQQSSGAVRDYYRWNREREQLDQEIRQSEEERAKLDKTIRALEAVAGLRGRWQERTALDEQLAALAALPRLPENAVDRYETLGRRISQRRQRMATARQRYRELRSEARGLVVNDAVLEQSPRIAKVSEEFEAVALQENQLRGLNAEIADLESQLLAEPTRPNTLDQIVPIPVGSNHPTLDPVTISRLSTLASALDQARERAEEAKRDALRLQEEAELAPVKQRPAAIEPPPAEPGDSLESAGTLVAQLRRRLQLEQRLEGLNRQEVELEARCNELIDNQLLPVGVLAGLGALFVVGVILILAGMFLPATVTGSSGLGLAVLGIGGTVAAAAAKHKLEHIAERQLETTEKQISTLRSQIHQARIERDSLDELLPRGGGPLTVRLQAAEQRLAELEASLPSGQGSRVRPADRQQRRVLDLNELQTDQAERETNEPRRRPNSEEREAIRARAKDTHRRHAELRREWAAALAESAVRVDMSPQEFLATAHLYVPVRPTVAKMDDSWRLDQEQRRRELERRRDQRRLDRDHALHHIRIAQDRVHQLVAEIGVSLPGLAPADQLSRLRQLVREQQVVASRRKRIITQARRIRRRRKKACAELSNLCRRRRSMLRRAGAWSEEEFRRIASGADQLSRLRLRRETVERELIAARSDHCTEDELRQWLTAEDGRPVEARWEEATSHRESVDARLRRAQDRRNRLADSLSSLAGDRRPAERQLELNAIEERLRSAREQWQVLATAQLTLQSVRQHYESERQPETLREATGHLERLTVGRYRRIWTPLDEDILYVDNDEGKELSVESLSRGTREQVFLSLRLALASAYARRGAVLPLILDDVLVNFDDERAKATANVLVEYASSGRQMFVFTCHEHIMRLFKARRAPIIRLPRHTAGSARAAVDMETVSVRKKQRKEIPVEVSVVPADAEPASAREVLLDPLSEGRPFTVAPSVALPAPRAPAPVIVLPFAEIHPPEPPVPSPHFVPQPQAEPRWLRDPGEAPSDPDAELVIDDSWRLSILPRLEHDPREAPADPDEDLSTDDDFLRRLRELDVQTPTPQPAAESTVAEPRIVRRVIRRRWRPFTGEGAEEFAGEFAVRPAPGRWEEWEEAEDGSAIGHHQQHSADEAHWRQLWTAALDGDGKPIPTDGSPGPTSQSAASEHFPHNFDVPEAEAVWQARLPLVRLERAS